MDITRYELFDTDELLNNIKKTRLLGFDQAYVYENADIALKEAVNPNTLIPAQRYVLDSIYRSVVALYEAFSKKSINIFALKGGLFFWKLENGQEIGPIPLIPPVIETSVNANGLTVDLINDGMHRVYTATSLGVPINIVYIHNASHPYYAYPLIHGWEDVRKLNTLPKGFVKKTYRDAVNYKALFRNFNDRFPGIQEKR